MVSTYNSVYNTFCMRASSGTKSISCSALKSNMQYSYLTVDQAITHEESFDTTFPLFFPWEQGIGAEEFLPRANKWEGWWKPAVSSRAEC